MKTYIILLSKQQRKIFLILIFFISVFSCSLIAASQQAGQIHDAAAAGDLIQKKKNKVEASTVPTPLHLDFATLLGGRDDDRAHGMAVDGQGNIYLTAPISSTDFPTTPGALNKTPTSVYLAKLSPTGTLLCSTFLGAPGGANYAHGIAVDKEGCIYIAGNTTNPNFPTSSGAFQTTFKGPVDVDHHGDAFVVKLSPAGDRIIYSTFLGGTDMDICGKIAVDAEGNAYVAGCTSSKDFPVTHCAFDATFNGGGKYGRGDVFIAKLNPSGSRLVYCTYLGGTGLDVYNSDIIVDTLGSVYVVGTTTSPDFPVTGNAFRRTYSGDSGGRGMGDAFLIKLNPAGTALEYASYVGGSGDDVGRSVAVDCSGNIWLSGETASNDFPTTADAFSRRNKDGTDGFFVKINPHNGELLYSSLLGGSKAENMILAIHRSGLLILAGQTESHDFPVTQQNTIDTIKGQSDIYIALFDESRKSLRYSTLFGGCGIDNPSALICREDYLYIAGNTTSTDFPVITGATFKGGTNPYGGDAFAVRFTFIAKDEEWGNK
jgi:hypothetical protein